MAPIAGGAGAYAAERRKALGGKSGIVGELLIVIGMRN